MFREYDSKILKILDDPKEINWNQILEKHKLMIQRIQHERLIHLLVTIFVGIVFTITAISNLFMILNYGLLAVNVLLLILFIAYLLQYRFLENTTQKWYELEEKIISRK